MLSFQLQRTASSGSVGSFDCSSKPNKSIESGYPPDAPTKKPVHSSVNHHSVGSSMSHSTQSYALPLNMSFQNSSDQNSVSQKPVDLSRQTAPTRPPVPAQPTAFTSLDLFDQSTIQHSVTTAGTMDLFAGFDEQSLPVSHKTIDSGSQPDVAKEHIHTVLVQKTVAPSSVPAEASTMSQPVHQDLFSLSMLQEPVTSSYAPQIDMFAGFGQELPHKSRVQQIPSQAPSPANEGWAFFDTHQHGSLTPVSHLQAQMPAAFLPTDGIAKDSNQSTVPTIPQNTLESQSSPTVMDNWSLNAEAVKVPVSTENSQVTIYIWSCWLFVIALHV
jgi:Arf-GAP domain and FG repeats-containing protein 1